MDLKELIGSELQAISQRESFEYFAFRAAKKSALKVKWGDKSELSQIAYAILEDAENYKNADVVTPSGRRVNRVSIGNLARKASEEITLLVCTTNDLAKYTPEKILNVLTESARLIMVIHDYDNHHWFSMSAIALKLADVYIPAHEYNLQVTRRLCHHPVYPVAVGSIQWRREFLLNRQEDIFRSKRGNLLAGMHVFYPQFSHRNRVLATLATAIPTVGFIEHHSYRAKTAEDRLKDWISAKIHLICPTTLDIPLRFFDALITGGLPIVPTNLKPFLDQIGIPKSHYGIYDVEDILNPLEAQAKWLNHFDALGISGVIDRHYFAMRSHHLDHALDRCFGLAEEILATCN